MNLAESSVLDDDTIQKIQLLLDQFDSEFSSLYPKKSVTSVVHSMAHLPQTLRNFGPVQNYSTFNFESVIGSIVQSVNGPNLIVSELTNNLNLLQGASTSLNNANFNRSLKLFITRLFASKRCALPKDTSPTAETSVRFGREFSLPNDHIVLKHLRRKHILPFTLHQTCWKKKVQFSIYVPGSTAKNCDACVLFQSHQGRPNCGFLMAIISDSKRQPFVVVHLVCNTRQDFIKIKDQCIVNPYMFWGNLTDPPQLLEIRLEDVMMKLAFSRGKEYFHFFQFPNLVEST